jgi:hypothetical protein
MDELVWDDTEKLEAYLKEIVSTLSQTPDGAGGVRYRYRNVWNIDTLREVCEEITNSFSELGYEVRSVPFQASFGYRGEQIQEQSVTNLVVEIPGSALSEEIIIVGAHYDSRTAMKGDNDLEKQRGRIPDNCVDPQQDSRWNTPGANDNGSGVAALLALAHAFKKRKFQRTLRLVAWVNEEFPFYANTFAAAKSHQRYHASGMGSYHHARHCATGSDNSGIKENIVGVITLDTMGCYPGDGYIYPGKSLRDLLMKWVLRMPETGDFVGFLSDAPSKTFMRNFAGHFSRESEIDTFCFSVPRILNVLLKNGAWSDDWSYWQFGYPGFIVTDMAYLRSPRYHRNDDTVEHIDFPEFAKVVWRLRESVEALAEKQI